MANCLVTGVAGFIGSTIAERLLAKGWHVTGIDCLTEYYSLELKHNNLSACASHPHFRWVNEDLNQADLSELLKGIDLVFHEAGLPGVRGSWGSNFALYLRNNIEATQKLLEAVRGSSIEKLVYASSSSVYGRVALPMVEHGLTHPCSPYGVSKLAAEHLCMLYAQNFGIPVTAVRYFTVFGPRQRPDMAFTRFLRAMREGKEVRIFGSGEQSRDFTYVDDAVEGTLLAAMNGVPAEVYNIGGGCRATLNDAIRLLERVTGRTARIVRYPAEDGDVPDTLADTTKARDILGFRPRVDLESGLKSQASWDTQHADRSADTMGNSTRNSPPSPRARQRSNRPRVLLYSHDTYGLGHLRRNLAIADYLLARDPPFSALLLTGSPVVASWPLPPDLEVQPLPTVVKIGAEEYAARHGALSFASVKARRESLILETIARYHPDVFLVDHAPAGMKGELRSALAHIRREMPSTRTVIGLRDILDSSEVVRELWRDQKIYDLLESFYDRILVYGCRDLFDVVREYDLADDVAAKVRYCGYVKRSPANSAVVTVKALKDSGVPASAGRTVLVTAGGGEDGYPLMDAYLTALRSSPPGTFASVLVLGPLMSTEHQDAVVRAASQRPDVKVLPFTTALVELLGAADLVVAMGGYNTSVEILDAVKPAIIVPRVTPRTEQLLRATLLGDLGLVWVVRPDEDVVARLAELVPAALAGARPPRNGRRAIDLCGVGRVADALDELLGIVPATAS